MCSEAARQRIQDMLDAIGRVREYVSDMDFEVFGLSQKMLFQMVPIESEGTVPGIKSWITSA